ncbi:MAG: C_GCAxxG_C_C family protein [Ruminococcaceae bacterium]|nr:C_GCAxxG_C_C family protein [Oscillospiraceae bacterium]
MESKREKAMKLFKEGYNCSQAVLLAFADDLGIDKKTAAMLASSFGGGMGRMREVCGAVSAMFMIAGLKYGYSDPLAQEEKKEHYELIQRLAQSFKEKNHSIICRELLDGVPVKEGAPEERTEQYYKKRPCAELVGDAAEIVEKLFK